MNKVYFYWLDLIRFIAAFAVVACHTRGNLFVNFASLPEAQQNIVTKGFFFITRLGQEAVLMFFVLSGFLVAGKGFEKIKTNSFNSSSYTLDRAVRIIIPLIVAVLVTALIRLFTGGDVDILTLTGNLLSLQGVLVGSFSAPFWSLAYEVWFYVILGSFAVLINSKTLKKLLIPITLLLIGLLVFTKLKAIYLIIWLVGGIFYKFKNYSIPKYYLILNLIMVFIFIGILQLNSDTKSFQTGFISSFNRDSIELILSLLYGFLIIQVINLKPKLKISKLLESSGKKLASFSFTLYLVHYPLLGLLKYLGVPKSTKIDVTSISYYIGGLVASLIFSYLIYQLSEKHTYKIKQVIKNKLILK